MSLLVGRPSKYRPEYCDMVVEHMSHGYGLETFAAKISVCKDTVYEWTKVFPEFSDAVERGRCASLRYWETIGILGTMGKIKLNSRLFALQMANKHGWRRNGMISTADQKFEVPEVYVPPKEAV